MTSALAQWLDLCPNGYVYHYTSMEKLLKILDTQELWASEIRYLNDTTELGLALERALKELENRAARYEQGHEKTFLEAGFRYVQEAVINFGKHMLEANVFVISFSEDPDSLSQWRAYFIRAWRPLHWDRAR